MNKFMKKMFSILVTAIFIVSFITGCGQTTGNTTTASDTKDESSQTTAAATEKPKYSVTGNEKVTLTSLGAPYTTNPEAPLVNGDFSKIPWCVEMENRTGVHLEFMPVTPEDYQTKFSLLASSGELPDIYLIAKEYAGGVSKAIADGLALNVANYWQLAPNLKKMLDSNKEWMDCVKGDDGGVYFIPNLMEDPNIQCVYFGPIIRKDILDAAGLPLPETIDEWHTSLKALKDAGFASPFASKNWYLRYCSAFSGAYGVSQPYMVPVYLDGTLKYGPVQPGYKDFLATMAQWYREGLIDPDWATLKDANVLKTKITTGQSGACVGWLSDVTDYTSALQVTNPKAEMVATKYPVLNKGEKPLFGQKDPVAYQGPSLNAKSKNLEVLVKFIDYWFSEEGTRLINFGIENESYTLDASGNPVFTELVTAQPKNSKGWDQNQAINMYSPVSGMISIGLQLKSSFEQLRVAGDLQKDALVKWSDIQLRTATNDLPFTPEETEIIQKLGDIDTYTSEMYISFIMGTQPISEFDKYLEHCRKLGIDEVVAAYNAAYQRYISR